MPPEGYQPVGLPSAWTYPTLTHPFLVTDEELSQTSIAGATPTIPTPSAELQSSRPHRKDPLPHPEGMTTPSTPTALTSPGQNSPKSTKTSSALGDQKPEGSDDEMSKTDRGSGDPTTENPWTSTSPAIRGTHYLPTEESESSWPGSSPIKTENYMVLQPDLGSWAYDPEREGNNEN
ncbi:uncharacterized protein ARMOST_07541 [Armillaria ostoyae]|uniref:Uncharacterized protein n=1 Tax=Armillaria ostoyae TaxID=47428 RepID=A0A284R633_ARMOS|nr:uncharacterized protein ARMOST_07541 [Armillaria ostoyae]